MLTESPYPMISVEQAQRTILAHAAALASEQISFLDGLGRVLAQELRSRENLPSRPRSAVDGYAVVGLSGPTSLRVLGELTAGQISLARVEPGTAMRIMTGGLLPDGADAVIMVEDTRENDGVVEAKKGLQPGENVHPTAQDLEQGQTVLQPGYRLGSPE